MPHNERLIFLHVFVFVFLFENVLTPRRDFRRDVVEFDPRVPLNQMGTVGASRRFVANVDNKRVSLLKVFEFRVGEAATADFTREVADGLAYLRQGAQGGIEESVQERIQSAIEQAKAVESVNHYPILVLSVVVDQFIYVEHVVRQTAGDEDYDETYYYFERANLALHVEVLLLGQRCSGGAWRRVRILEDSAAVFVGLDL